MKKLYIVLHMVSNINLKIFIICTWMRLNIFNCEWLQFDWREIPGQRLQSNGTAKIWRPPLYCMLYGNWSLERSMPDEEKNRLRKLSVLWLWWGLWLLLLPDKSGWGRDEQIPAQYCHELSAFSLQWWIFDSKKAKLIGVY